MATVIERKDTTKSLNSRVQLPRCTCAVQCIKEEFVESKNSKNMMIHRTWQIIKQPPELVINGENYDICGLELEEYLVTKKSDGKGGFLPADNSDVKKMAGRVYENYDKLGVTLDGAIDFDNPPLLAKGLVMDASIESEEKQRLNPPTQEELARGQKVGSPKVDADGKKEVFFQTKLSYLMGRSSTTPLPF